MAMALKSETHHYHWCNVQRGHFFKAAKNANYSTEKAEVILYEMLNKVDTVIEEVCDQLPPTFPKQISQSIFDGMRSMSKRLMKTPFKDSTP